MIVCLVLIFSPHSRAASMMDSVCMKWSKTPLKSVRQSSDDMRRVNAGLLVPAEGVNVDLLSGRYFIVRFIALCVRSCLPGTYEK